MGKARVIKVGDRYDRKCGKAVSKITITGITDDGIAYQTQTGKEGVTSAEDVSKWTFVSHGTKSGKAVTPRINATTCLKVAIDTILEAGRPMHAKDIVDVMKSKKTYIFSANAKTPWNSISTRLTQNLLSDKNAPYMKAPGIRGAFVPVGWKAPETEPATATA